MLHLYVRPLSLAKQRSLHLWGTLLTKDHEQQSTNMLSVADSMLFLLAISLKFLISDVK
jgi:hypothetical protein